MAIMTNLLVKDDAATPKEWTLVPVTDTPVPFYRAQDTGIPIEGQPRLYLSTEKLKSGAYKISAKLEVPVMETLGASGTSSGYVASPKVAFVNTAIFTSFADKRSTNADRANLTRMMIGLLQGAGATTGGGIYANTGLGGTFLALTSALPQLFTNLVLPN
jgi:hypothetical protein